MTDFHLKVQDLNTIIKYFATNIQYQIEQLQKINRIHHKRNKEFVNSNTMDGEGKISNEQSAVQQIVEKYKDYLIEQEMQKQYIRKFNNRILQIFGFYKMQNKTISITVHAQRQLTNRLNILLNSTPCNLSKILIYIINISQKGFININENIREKISEKATPKSNSSIEKYRSEEKSNTKQIHLWTNHPIDHMLHRKRRVISVAGTYATNYSFPKNPPQANLQQQSKTFDTLYGILSIDKQYLLKHMENLQKQQLKRNKSVVKTLTKELKSQHNSYRKMRTQTSNDREILDEIRNRTKIVKCFQQESREFLKKAPILNFSIYAQKRRKIKTSQKNRHFEVTNQNNQNLLK